MTMPPRTVLDGDDDDRSHTVAPGTTRDAPVTSRDTPGRTAGGGGPLTQRDGAAGVPGRPGRPGGEPFGVGAGYLRFNLFPPLLDEYEVIKDLSTTGGEADLAVCRRLSDGVEVAVKQYRARHGEVKRSVLDQVRQAAHGAGGSHLLHILDAGAFEGYWWEVQELVKFGSLQDLIEREGPTLPASLVREVLAQVADALAHVHTRDLVHRDVKPPNILVRGRQPLNVVLGDFGLAVVLAASREMRSGSRTSAYAGPEAAWGDVSASMDYWSLGITLLELLTGTHPFRLYDGRWLEDAQINSMLATRPIDLQAVTDPRWRHLLRGLLTRDPKHRWTDTEIRDWLHGGTPEVKEDTPPARDARARRPSPVFAKKSFHDPRELAVAMVATKETWREAATLVLGRGFDELEEWLTAQGPSDGLLRAISHCKDQGSKTGQQRFKPDRLVAMLATEMNPDLPPVFRGFSIAPADLNNLTRTAAAGNSEASETLVALSASRSLLTYAACDGCEEFPVLDDVWERNIAEVKERSKATQVPDALRRQAADVAPHLLNVILNTDAAAELHARAEAAPTALHRPWYDVMGGGADDDLTPAVDWLKVAAAPLAQEEHAAIIRKEQEAARQREAARLAQEQADARATQQADRRRSLERMRHDAQSRLDTIHVRKVGLGFIIALGVPAYIGLVHLDVWLNHYSWTHSSSATAYHVFASMAVLTGVLIAGTWLLFRIRMSVKEAQQRRLRSRVTSLTDELRSLPKS
ncbi:MAG: protein kinase domain-containing protein [Acidimicrobiales bacterium]